MIRNRKTLIGIIIFISVVVSGFTGSYLFKINKSFEIFGAVFREISANYVDEVDPEQLVDYALDGMLEKLDPYTVYYDEEASDDVNYLVKGSYIGLGITIGRMDSMLTILEVVDGYPASNAGIRIGDKIFEVDGHRVLNMKVDKLRKYTRGDIGTSMVMKVLREKDTLTKNLKRGQIKISNVSYSDLLFNDFAYIKIERFSKTTAEELRLALNRIKSRSNINGIILDLRDNPGGLLQAAVSVCEIFLPKGSKIVTTKGRKNSSEFTYRSVLDPMEPDLPLAVLINKRSASASEIVAGAIQDLDRGIVIGERSFGKGLVQSVIDLPYKTNLKMTTAKYYTPSGRCIQKLDYSTVRHGSDKAGRTHDTSDFYTMNGRPVNASNGIKPDICIDSAGTSKFIDNLKKKFMFFKYANSYSAKLDSLPDDFAVDNEMLEDFSRFTLDNKEFQYQTEMITQIKNARKIARDERLSDNILNDISLLEKKIAVEEEKIIFKYKAEISEILEEEIKSRFLSQIQMTELSLSDDEFITLAAKTLRSANYGKILAKGLKGENVNN